MVTLCKICDTLYISMQMRDFTHQNKASYFKGKKYLKWEVLKNKLKIGQKNSLKI